MNRRLPLVLALAVSAMAADCSYGDSSKPNSNANIAGTYTLQTVDGNALPTSFVDGAAGNGPSQDGSATITGSTLTRTTVKTHSGTVVRVYLKG